MCQVGINYCDKCEYSSIGKYDLKVHYQSNHDITGNVYKCIQCDYISKRKHKLANHIGSKYE